MARELEDVLPLEERSFAGDEGVYEGAIRQC
jgi:hypothetical protein